jgi:hypothetical protein
MPCFIGSRPWPRGFVGGESSRRTLGLRSEFGAELATAHQRVIVR